MKVSATKFKQNFGHYSELITEGTVKEIEVTNRGKLIGIYSNPKRSERIPFFGVETSDLSLDREVLNERG